MFFTLVDLATLVTLVTLMTLVMLVTLEMLLTSVVLVKLMMLATMMTTYSRWMPRSATRCWRQRYLPTFSQTLPSWPPASSLTYNSSHPVTARESFQGNHAGASIRASPISGLLHLYRSASLTFFIIQRVVHTHPRLVQIRVFPISGLLHLYRSLSLKFFIIQRVIQTRS